MSILAETRFFFKRKGSFSKEKVLFQKKSFGHGTFSKEKDVDFGRDTVHLCGQKMIGLNLF